MKAKQCAGSVLHPNRSEARVAPFSLSLLLVWELWSMPLLPLLSDTGTTICNRVTDRHAFSVSQGAPPSNAHLSNATCSWRSLQACDREEGKRRRMKEKHSGYHWRQNEDWAEADQPPVSSCSLSFLIQTRN